MYYNLFCSLCSYSTKISRYYFNFYSFSFFYIRIYFFCFFYWNFCFFITYFFYYLFIEYTCVAPVFLSISTLTLSNGIKISLYAVSNAVSIDSNKYSFFTPFLFPNPLKPILFFIIYCFFHSHLSYLYFVFIYFYIILPIIYSSYLCYIFTFYFYIIF